MPEVSRSDQDRDDGPETPGGGHGDPESLEVRDRGSWRPEAGGGRDGGWGQVSQAGHAGQYQVRDCSVGGISGQGPAYKQYTGLSVLTSN